jgi:ribosomal-protein-alanine N-acetyltransferase
MSDGSVDSQHSHVVLDKYLKTDSILSIRNDNKIIGFLIEQIVQIEAELIQIVIGDAFRSQGYATDAMLHWHAQLLTVGVQDVFLEVREDNQRAKELYDKLGYENIGRRKNYYNFRGSTRDAILMKASL